MYVCMYKKQLQIDMICQVNTNCLSVMFSLALLLFSTVDSTHKLTQQQVSYACLTVVILLEYGDTN